MKSIFEVSRLERLERALLAIEALAHLEWDKSFYTFADLQREKYLRDNYKSFVDEAYMIAHAALGKCEHKDWLLKIEELEEDLKKGNIYDVDKYMDEKAEIHDLETFIQIVSSNYDPENVEIHDTEE